MKYIFEILRDKNVAALIYGTICFLGFVFCFFLSKLSSIQIMGISGWIKPMKFFLSVAIFTWTMGFYLHYLENQRQVQMYTWSMIILFSVELIFIVYQASKGKMSHFNMVTPIDSFIFNLMAIAISILMFHTLYMSVLFFNQNQFSASDTMILAVKLSLLITVIFAFEGFVMGAILKHTIGNEDGSPGLPVLNWSKKHGDLRVAHFFGIHALQVIPLITYLIAKTKRDVIIISIIYFVFVTYTLIQALQAKSFIKL